MKIMQVSILKKALGDRGFESLVEQYRNVSMRRSRDEAPTASQIRLASLGKTLGAKEAARQAGVSPNKVDYAMNRVARYEWLNR
jgi:hypothetical protein